MDQIGFELETVILPQPLKYWDYIHHTWLPSDFSPICTASLCSDTDGTEVVQEPIGSAVQI